MINVKIAGNQYKIKNGWNDIEPIDLYNLRSNLPKDQLAVLSDIPIELIDNLPSDGLLSLYSLVSFIDDIPDQLTLEREIKIGKEAWKKLEILRQSIKTKSIHHISFEACRIYFGEDVLKWPINKILGQASQIINELEVFLERFKDLNEDNPYDDDQIEAGVKAFETFGAFGILYSLADGDVTKYDQINEMNAEMVYFTLLFEKAKNDYNTKLKKIYDRQNGIRT
jgi:hypothetical protein